MSWVLKTLIKYTNPNIENILSHDIKYVETRFVFRYYRCEKCNYLIFFWKNNNLSDKYHYAIVNSSFNRYIPNCEEQIMQNVLK